MSDDNLFATDLDLFLSDDEPGKDEKEEGKDGEGTDDPDKSESESGENKEEESEKDPDEKERDEDSNKVIEFSNAEDDDQELAEVAPFDLGEFKKKYPKALDEFPGLRPALIREQKFTEIFSTSEEAQVAYDRSEAFRNFESEFLSGQPENLLATLANNPDIKRNAPKAFDKFTSSFLPAVKRLAPEKFNQIIGTEVVTILRHIKKQAKLHKNEDLEKSVGWVTASLFDNPDPDEIQTQRPNERKNDDEDDDKNRFEEERKRFNQEKYDHAMGEVSSQVTTKLKTLISDGLDPNKRLNELNFNALSERIQKDVDILLSKDERHSKMMRQLWERASKNGFTAEWRNRIRDTYLTNAARVIPSIKMKRRDEAFKGMKGSKVADTKITSGRVPGKEGSPNGKGRSDTRRIDYSKTSDKDIFSDDPKAVKYR